VRALREGGHRVVGTDVNPASVASRLCERFVVVPRGDDPQFIPALGEVAADVGADVVFPTSSSEILAWARARDTFPVPVMAGPPAGVEAAADKAETFRLADRVGVPAPRTIEVSDPDAFAAAVRELGYPKRRVVMKPSQAKGSRGMRILDPAANRRSFDRIVQEVCHDFAHQERIGPHLDIGGRLSDRELDLFSAGAGPRHPHRTRDELIQVHSVGGVADPRGRALRKAVQHGHCVIGRACRRLQALPIDIVELARIDLL